ncbi:unnamed protein product [Scytosiphon promiscuus]
MMDSLPSKMREADQHLDRLGGILRSLRAPPSERVSTPTSLHRRKEADRSPDHHDPFQDRRKHHQHQRQRQLQQERYRQDQEQERKQDERRFLRASGSSLPSQSRSRTASQHSHPETGKTAFPTLHPHRNHDHHQHCHCSAEGVAGAGGPLIKQPNFEDDSVEEQGVTSPHRPRAERAALHEEDSASKCRRAGDVDDVDQPRTDATATAPVRPALCIGVNDNVAAAGAITNTSIREKASSPWLSSSLRKRATRTWWRGLSSGVCFAAGAWAREGHGLFGAALALAAMIVVEFIDTLEPPI